MKNGAHKPAAFHILAFSSNMNNKSNIFNSNGFLIIIGITSSLIISQYWNDLINLLTDIFGINESGDIASQQATRIYYS